jgi:hypothetical protein
MDTTTILFIATIVISAVNIANGIRWRRRRKGPLQPAQGTIPNWPPITRMAVALAMLTLVGCSEQSSELYGSLLIEAIIFLVIALIAGRAGYERGHKDGWESAVQRMHDLEQEDEA